MENKQLWTVSEITGYIGTPRHRVEYVIESRGIAFTCKMGNARVYTTKDRDLIASEIAKIDEAESK